MGSLRRKILRKPGEANYPVGGVCDPCGLAAAKGSKARVEEYIQYTFGTCHICGTVRVPVATPRDFGWPTFYTYENGTPVN